MGKARKLLGTNLKSYKALGVAVGPLGVGVAGRRVGVGVTGRLVAVGGGVVGVGVSVTAGVGVTVGVSVGVGVGVSTGVGVCVDVGVKVGLGVLVGVAVGVGDPMNELKEQPSMLTMTSTATNAAEVVTASFLPVLIKFTDPLSPNSPCGWQYYKPKREIGHPPPWERICPVHAPVLSPVGRRQRVVG